MAGLTVLVVDDDESIRQVTVIALASEPGWDVLSADGGDAALASCRAASPDVILLDLMMPGMDGIATFEALQQDPATRHIPVILFTAKGVARGRQPWGGHGFAGVIVKPFDPLTLGSQIRQLLDT